MVSSRGNGTLIGAGWHAQKIQTDPLPNSDRGTLGEQILVFPMRRPCDIDAPAQDDTRRESLDFIGI
jgi:hypothetical protein